MKLLMLFVDNFEDTEAIATLDVLSRGGHEIVKASLMNRLDIKPKYSLRYDCDVLIDDLDLDSFEGVILPGGPGCIKTMSNINKVYEIIDYLAKKSKLIAAICAAPHILGKLGILKDIEYTVFHGFESYCMGGKLLNKGVVTCKNIITAKSMYYSIEFALAIDEYLTNEEHRKQLEESLKGN